MFYKVFHLQGTATQNAKVKAAIDRTLFPWHFLSYGLYRKTRKRYIPVEWADLSTFGTTPAAMGVNEELVGEVLREHGTDKHLSQPFHVIQYRERVLGLAWYSGKITLEKTLENDPNPDLAAEVFASEVAHMADFFYMANSQRQRVYEAYHGGPTNDHGHAWFDKGAYADFVGESFMEGFVKAYSDIPVTITGFTHPTTANVVAEINDALGPKTDPLVPSPTIEVPPGFQHNSGLWFTTFGSSRFHRNHRGLRENIVWPTREQAAATGRIPCRICNP